MKTKSHGNPKVSVVSISFNHGKYIREMIESVISQKTKFNFELIIYDDASTDNTQQIISEYANKFPKIIKPYLRKKNVGVGKNFADALMSAHGEYIAICEGDDYWTNSNKLQLQVTFLDDHKDYALCFHPIDVFFDSNPKIKSVYPVLEKGAKLTVERLLKENYIPTNSVMYRRLKLSSLPTDIMPPDWYMHLYHAKYGRIGFIDKKMAAYRRHEQGVWWESHNDQGELWKKYGLSMLAMRAELLKLFGENLDCRKIIYHKSAEILDKLIEVDNKTGSKLYKKALSTYPELFDDYLLTQHDRLTEVTDQLQKAQADLQKTRDEVKMLRDSLEGIEGLVVERDEELKLIKSSKAWRLKTKYGNAKNIVKHSLAHKRKDSKSR